MQRRAFLALAVLFAAPAAGHSPYRQWKVLRERYLLVHSTREDPASDELAERISAAINKALPRANATVARAPSTARLASLLTTGQAVLGVLRGAQGQDLFRGEGQFRDLGGRVVRRLLEFGDFDLITVESLPRHHAWLLASALTDPATALSARVPSSNGVVPVHAGALAFARGEPLEAQE
jgi:hypothetical protein